MNLRLWTLPPFALVLGAMAYLWSRFEELPARYPVHWGISGQPDRWVQKGAGAVLLPGLVGLAVVALLAFNAWQVEKSRRGSRKSAAWMVVLEWAVALLFVVMVLLPVLPPMGQGFTLAMILVPTALVVAVAIGVSRETWQAPPAGPECWRWGVFYFNPDDPDVMVPKRTGLGYTMNFARPASWAILGALILILPLALLWLR